MAGIKKPTFEGFNTNYQMFRKRADENGSKKLFAAGIFTDLREKVLMVHDQQELNKLWYKLPGGVPDSSCLNEHKDFVEELVKELRKMRYSELVISQIIERENLLDSQRRRLVPEKSLILEMVEETGFYPTEFGYTCDGFRYNRNSGKHDLWMVFFQIQKVISPNSKNLECTIRHVSNVKTLESLDKDVKEMRVVVPFADAIAKLGPATHKEALATHFRKQERYYHANDEFVLAQKYAMALMDA